jgi:thiol:disulfide interchange protein DsbD
MAPGLWGAPLKAISAFSPPLKTQDFNLYKGEVHAKFDVYEAGMEYARKNNKPVMLDFTGAGCVNCRKMEAYVWTDIRVKQILENDYVLITLETDIKRELPEVMEVTLKGKKVKLKTVGDKWGYLQQYKFGSISQPYYVLLDYNGKPAGPSYAYDEDIDKYIEFLNTGLDNFKKRQNELKK